MYKGDFNYEVFFLDLVNQVNEIVSNLNPNGIIRISKTIITKLGFHDRSSFEEGLLHKVYAKVARISGIDFKTIEEKIKDRILLSEKY